MSFKKSVIPEAHHSRAEIDVRIYESDLAKLKLELKPFILQIAEQAFRIYAKAHKADQNIEDLEWLRFKRILEKKL